MIATVAAVSFAVTTIIALVGWWSTTLVARRELHRAFMAEAKYRALLTEFSTPGGVRVPF